MARIALASALWIVIPVDRHYHVTNRHCAGAGRLRPGLPTRRGQHAGSVTSDYEGAAFEGARSRHVATPRTRFILLRDQGTPSVVQL